MDRKIGNYTLLQIAAHIGSWIPLAYMVFDLLTKSYGPDPIREFTLRTGKTALILLMLSLACTPFSTVTSYKGVLKLRRPLGLYSFMYASIHFAIFIGVDYFFDFELIQDALLEKRYAIIGLTTGIILLILAVTSNKFSQRRLKKNWKKLHLLAYAAGALAVLHFIWLVKQGVPEPWYYAALLGFLFLLRIKPIKGWVQTMRKKIGKAGKKARA